MSIDRKYNAERNGDTSFAFELNSEDTFAKRLRCERSVQNRYFGQ